MANPESDTPRNKAGLKIKYDVKKIDDPEGKHNNCDYFVLDPLHDDMALRVLTLYGDLTADESLSNDLRSWLQEIRIQRVQVKYQVQELKDRLGAEQADRILHHLDPTGTPPPVDTRAHEELEAFVAKTLPKKYFPVEENPHG